MKQKIGTSLLLCLWAALAFFAWFTPSKDISNAERRGLAQMPQASVQTLLSGSFMEDFEQYTLDQFPLRDAFRKVKAIFHYYVLGQKDNNGIYIANGSAAQQEYPLNAGSVSHALDRFDAVYTQYLADSGSAVYFCVVPDKGYYLAEENGQLAMDYAALIGQIQAGTPWASYVDITGDLSAGDYYRTDTHWRQENLLNAAGTLCRALGVTVPLEENYTVTGLERPFYGVYYGQAALPMEADTICLLENDLLRECTVYDYETGVYTDVYDRTRLDSRDLYDVYLSGAKALLTIENPNAATDRELVIFRDSFGSSMAPLLMDDYARVTLVDLRYISTDMLGQFLEFDGQDVLFLYSTLVLNNSASIK